ncbi:histidine kinase [Beutenbergia cavernae DSM 12333]|uniref:Oxygen sensor histidine kinase NreB n=1 Tax=Beutenbergia cavernae (strain ATCC BAA-8 / DSM 12333 / CCUG 43141 / JCM 11478 / NBRC 16432 / NCIMB 13614 / HKI 0122) TaxID=471853 RepID=C5BV54_BEUC1|nr:ATP-binding protein [Beutenbergia cavernae]ACQ80441.1 histidine kinase [Beutenbergia cavernae DSM 12333]
MVWAQIVVVAVTAPLVVALVHGALRRDRVLPREATATILLAAGTVAVVDPGGTSTTWNGLVNAITLSAAAVLLATFPDGRFVPRWTLWPVALAVAVQMGNVASGFRWDDQSAWWPWHILVTWLVLLLGGQVYRYVRRSGVDERERTRWAVLGFLAQITLFVVMTAVLVGLTGTPDGALGSSLAMILNLLGPTGLAVGLLAPRIVPVDRALHVGIQVSVVGLGVTGCVVLTTALLPEGGNGRATSWAAAAVVALVTLPLAWCGAKVAHRVVYGGRPDPLTTLAALGQLLDRSLDPRAVPVTVLRTLCDSLGLEGARLSGDQVFAAEHGELPRVAGRFGIRFRGEELATFEVAPRPGETTLTEHDRRVVDALARQAGAALDGTRAITELVAARSRVVTAREEERRRLRRDLHDDLVPTLAGLGLDAAAITELLRGRDDAIARVAATLAQGIRDSTRQIREIAYDLRPPVLDDHGLVAAVRDRVASTSGAPRIVIDAPEERIVLSAALESAALRIVQEAVMNVRRHAAAEVCRIRISLERTTLHVTVADDGRGLPVPRREGLGLRSIRERVYELGGSLVIAGAPGQGTSIAVQLPYREAPERAEPRKSGGG